MFLMADQGAAGPQQFFLHSDAGERPTLCRAPFQTTIPGVNTVSCCANCRFRAMNRIHESVIGAFPAAVLWGQAGRSTVSFAPPPSRVPATIVPLCSVTMRRQIGSPRPVPLGLVVANGSNNRAIISPAMPGPVSEMITRIKAASGTGCAET